MTVKSECSCSSTLKGTTVDVLSLYNLISTLSSVAGHNSGDFTSASTSDMWRKLHVIPVSQSKILPDFKITEYCNDPMCY